MCSLKITALYIIVWETWFTVEPHFLSPSILSRLFVLVWWNSRGEHHIWSTNLFFVVFFFSSFAFFLLVVCLTSRFNRGAVSHQRTMQTDNRKNIFLDLLPFKDSFREVRPCVRCVSAQLAHEDDTCGFTTIIILFSFFLPLNSSAAYLRIWAERQTERLNSDVTWLF